MAIMASPSQLRMVVLDMLFYFRYKSAKMFIRGI